MSFTLFPYSDSSRTEILRLWSRALPLDAVSEGMFESRVLLDENFDPEYFLLARQGPDLVGCILGAYAKRMPLGDADPDGTRCWITALAVDPSADLNAVGSTLIKELERKFAALGKKECLVSTYPPGYFTPGIDQRNYTPLLDLFLSHGYVKQKEAISMDSSIVLFTVSDAVKENESELRKKGIEIRPYRRTDLLNFLSFLEQTMPSDWVRVERRNLKKISEGRFTENQITVVTHGKNIIGYCQFEGAHFGPFGVSDAYQGRGIGTVLLARTIERMKTDGHHDAWVMWTDDVAAKVYGKFGFKETRIFAILKKELL
jgi:GNAT superfamily N-acetyltransferase